MGTEKGIRILAMGIGNGRRDDVVDAIVTMGWGIDFASDAEEMVSLAALGSYHLVLLACWDSRCLSKQQARMLMGLQDDLSVIILVSQDREIEAVMSQMGATSDQVHSITLQAYELVSIMRHELTLVVQNQPQYTVVCVDDDEAFMASLEALLTSHLKKTLARFSLRVESFVNPIEALREVPHVTTGYPAVIISDQVMPGMKGIELLRQLKKLYPEAQCVLLTGHAALDSAVIAVNERILDKYFFKPVEDPTDFANNIRHLLLEHHLHAKDRGRRERLMSQFEFMRTISAAKSADDALDATIGFLGECFCPQGVAIALSDDRGCTVRAGFGLATSLSPGARLDGHPIVQQVLQFRQALVVSCDDGLNEGGTTRAAGRATLMAVPLNWHKAAHGVILLEGRARQRPFSREDRMLAMFAADVVAMTISNFEDRRALEDVYLGTMATLMETVEAKDVYTRGHTDRVTALAMALAEALNVTGEACESIRRAAALHDIGKIALPDWIILKAGPLDADERLTMQTHPRKAEKILQHLKFLDGVRGIIKAHHERYDGGGYPDGLKAEEIPLGARIIAIADSYDAMTSARPYRHAMDQEAALQEIEANACTQFDPAIAAVFVELMRDGENVCQTVLQSINAEGQDVEQTP